MTDEGRAVCSVCDSRANFFRGRQYIQMLISTEYILQCNVHTSNKCRRTEEDAWHPLSLFPGREAWPGIGIGRPRSFAPQGTNPSPSICLARIGMRVSRPMRTLSSAPSRNEATL